MIDPVAHAFWDTAGILKDYLFTWSLWKQDEKSKIKMAASPGGDEDSVFDAGRLSLFDLILERTRAQNKVNSLKCIRCQFFSWNSEANNLFILDRFEPSM